MAKQFAKLQRIENNRRITKKTDYEFLYQLQNALLLALKEQGRLSQMQYRHAEERLQAQRRDRARKLMEEGERE